jgi:hypothetical protein
MHHVGKMQISLMLKQLLSMNKYKNHNALDGY